MSTPVGEFDAEETAGTDSAALDRMDLAATVLDDGLRVPGTDFEVGLDPVIGVLPVAGDTISMALSLYIVVEAVLAGVSLGTVLHMLFNVAVDWVVGSVPVVGDLFDAGWKANRRNVTLAAGDLGVSVE